MKNGSIFCKNCACWFWTAIDNAKMDTPALNYCNMRILTKLKLDKQSGEEIRESKALNYKQANKNNSCKYFKKRGLFF